MIDNFDRLVERCTAKRRRQMIRRSLLITSAILSIVALIAGYLEIFSTPDLSVVTPKETKVATLPIDQHPITILPITTTAKRNFTPSVATSQKNTVKKRLYAIQLTSSSSYEQVKILLQKMPKQYQSGMGIYLVNHYYTLRYIDIYESNRVVPLINNFKQLGFEKVTLFKYNPDRIPLTDTMAALTAISPTAAIQPPKESVAPEVNPTPTAPHTNTTSIFSVTNQPKPTSSDSLSTFDKNPKYETAITIARDFYGKNNFVDAALWAKKANQLNREQEEAWLLYAQSYWAQGRKKEAVGVLELYMNYKDSKAASELYRTWKSSSSN